MSFFGEHGSVSSGGDFEVAEAGAYVCRLKEVEPIQQPSFDDPTTMVDKFRWVWETTEATDSKGNPFRFTKFTGRSFGNDKAAITILLDQMAGKRLTDAEYRSLDLDMLKRASWRVMVDEGVNGKGYAINKVLSVKNAAAPRNAPHVQNAPARPAPKPKAEEPMEDIDDPFNQH